MPKASSSKTQAKKIPRPMNCFLAFRLEKQSEIVARCPGANHRDISKIIAKWWKETPEEEKQPYRERARLAKIEHAKLYPDYKYKPVKKNGRKTRKYIRRPQDKFTSRQEENNRMMELFYKNPKLLEKPDSVAAGITAEQQQQQDGDLYSESPEDCNSDCSSSIISSPMSSFSNQSCSPFGAYISPPPVYGLAWQPIPEQHQQQPSLYYPTFNTMSITTTTFGVDPNFNFGTLDNNSLLLPDLQQQEHQFIDPGLLLKDEQQPQFSSFSGYPSSSSSSSSASHYYPSHTQQFYAPTLL